MTLDKMDRLPGPPYSEKEVRGGVNVDSMENSLQIVEEERNPETQTRNPEALWVQAEGNSFLSPKY